MSCLLALTLISGYKKIESIANQHFGVSETIIQDKNNPVIFGFDTGNYHLSTYKVNKGEVLGEILSEHGIGSDVIHMLEAKAKDIFNKGKLIAWLNILAIVKNHVGQYSMMDINSNRHLSKLSKAEKYRLLDTLNIPQLLIRQSNQQPAPQHKEDALMENRLINTIKKQKRKIKKKLSLFSK